MAADIATQVQSVINALNHVASYAWTALVKQQFIIGITDSIVTFFFTILAGVSLVFLTKGAKRLYRGYQGGSSGAFEAYWFYVLPSIVFIITWIFVFTFVGQDAIGHLLNPDGWAIQNIIHPQ